MPAATVHDFTSPPDWRPLERLTLILGDDAPRYHLGSLMYMGRAVNKYGVAIFLYKHKLTRGCLNLDLQCRAYRYCARELPSGQWSAGWYIPYRDLWTALSHARLTTVDDDVRWLDRRYVEDIGS